MKNILVVMDIHERQKKRLEEKAPDARITYALAGSVSKEQVMSANVIIGNLPSAMLKDAKSLEWLQLESAGTGDYVNPGVLPDGVVLTNATGAYGLAISEHMLGMLFMIYKKLYLYHDHQKKAEWADEGEVKPVYGSNVLIVGLGDIGGEFAKRMKALGARTIGIRRQGRSMPDYLDELYSMDKLDELLTRADIVALTLPSTSQTRGLFSRERIFGMKKDAVLLNIGRGDVLDTEGLCDALEQGYLLGAGLDVTDPEPLPKDHRLWKIKNAIITPHVSGGNHLPETYERIVSIAADNLDAYLNREPLHNAVDFDTGYRKL